MSSPRAPRILSAASSSSASSPNRYRQQNPTTPNRVVRSTRTPPASTGGLVALPGEGLLATRPPNDERGEFTSDSSSSSSSSRESTDRDSIVSSPTNSDVTYEDSFEEYCSDEDWCEPTTEPKMTSIKQTPGTSSAVSCVDEAHGSPKDDGCVKPPRPKQPSLEVEKLNKVGRGSFGDVFRCRTLDTMEIVAMKEIVIGRDSRGQDTARQLHQLEREIRVMQKLNHPNIVKYLGSKRNEDGLSIYMEFADGGTVGDELRESGPMTEVTAAGYVRQLLAGLEYLHNRRPCIVHRDLKGDNLFLTQTKHLKVGDFGTSKELQTLKYTDSVAGTPNFMAPEMIECVGHSTEADIWSVGCCAIQMLTAKAPFYNLDNQMAVMFAVLKGQIGKQVPLGCSDAFRDFIKVCTYREPELRWSCRALRGHVWLEEGGWSSTNPPTPDILSQKRDEHRRSSRTTPKD
jgi:hypothetical protein